MIELDEKLDWVKAMRDCQQDHIYHQEGDVLTHTLMVCEEMQKLDAYKNLPSLERQMMLTAAKLHDVGKPITSQRDENGRIHSKHHSWHGSVIARKLLWELNVPFPNRELICSIVRFHMRPYHFIKKDNPAREVAEISHLSRCDWQILMSTADTWGRKSNPSDRQESWDMIELFRQWATEANCMDKPHWFPDIHSRTHFFNKGTRHISDKVYDNTWMGVIVMSGLPGAGKDHWIKKEYSDWPVISLDKIREELKIDPADGQGKVIAAAKDKAKEYLRKKRTFIWNATNITKLIREEVIGLMFQYNARVKIEYVETDKKTLFKQNKERDNPVPEKVLNHLIDKWEPPNLTECHCLEYIIADTERNSVIRWPGELILQGDADEVNG